MRLILSIISLITAAICAFSSFRTFPQQRQCLLPVTSTCNPIRGRATPLIPHVIQVAVLSRESASNLQLNDWLLRGTDRAHVADSLGFIYACKHTNRLFLHHQTHAHIWRKSNTVARGGRKASLLCYSYQTL